MRLIISEIYNPSLSKVVSLLYMDRGVPQPAPGHWIIPASCAPNLKLLEETASRLSTEHVAPEDTEVALALVSGEAARYLDTEMVSFCLSRDSVAREIAARIPDGASLLAMVECVDAYLAEVWEKMEKDRIEREEAEKEVKGG